MKRIKLSGLVVIVAAMVSWDLFAGVATPSTIVVMPARRRLVELMSQVARIKDVGLVAFSAGNLSSAPLIHIWNGSEWLAISSPDYIAGNFMSGEPKRLLLLGDSASIPRPLSANPAWCSDVRRIAALDTASLLNEMDKILKFSPRQWTWLAELNGLVLTDHNAQRRRYGRWGAPNKEVTPGRPGRVDNVVMPPASAAPEAQARARLQEEDEWPAEPLPTVTPVVKPDVPKPVATEPAKVKPVKEDVVPEPAPVAQKPLAPEVAPPALPAEPLQEPAAPAAQ